MTGKAGFDQTQIFTPEDNEGLYQFIDFTAVSAPATNTIDNRNEVLLFSTEGCHFRFTKGASTALVTDTFLPGNTFVPFTITPGNTISAISDGTDGKLHISPVL